MALLEEATTAICHRDSPLTTSDAYDLLIGEEDIHVVSRLLYRPTGGNVFKYFNMDGTQDWRADGHRWVNQGTEEKRSIVKKKLFLCSD